MHCPFCGADDTKVIDSRLVAEGDQVRRRRECLSCSERYTTYEVAELVMPRVIKQNGSREPFDEEKLRAGFLRALEKRPVSVERIEEVISHIKHELRATGEREVQSLVLGELLTKVRPQHPVIRPFISGWVRFFYLGSKSGTYFFDFSN